MVDVSDCPQIRNAERSGYPDGKSPVYPRCPVCNAECDTVYRNKDFEVVGCEEYIVSGDAWESEECFPEMEER